ncbi:hypothetical protein DMC30DRAFT_398160 [Rhodotorula diobovata]|uniref:Uncharacterized protein n=1 Tax=Rhodotorula diobovata TaxID=5288 RepID=A0A5C5FUE2_9BASI|nr:hypothetical protein DMC30DRAFT_398160 [Rhodotorula diobovata]
MRAPRLRCRPRAGAVRPWEGRRPRGCPRRSRARRPSRAAGRQCRGVLSSRRLCRPRRHRLPALTRSRSSRRPRGSCTLAQARPASAAPRRSATPSAAVQPRLTASTPRPALLARPGTSSRSLRRPPRSARAAAASPSQSSPSRRSRFPARRIRSRLANPPRPASRPSASPRGRKASASSTTAP